MVKASREQMAQQVAEAVAQNRRIKELLSKVENLQALMRQRKGRG